jgi:hypothetical protein
MPTYIENFLDENLVQLFTYDNIISKLNENNNWGSVMKINGQEVKSGKVGSFYGLPDENGCLPYFRCPSFDEAFELTDWMKLLLDTINTKLNSKSNLIKIQHYVNGQSGIGSHSDKTLDMNPDENIIIFRINKDIDKTRCIVFKEKNTSTLSLLTETKYNMKSNSVLIITPDENKRMVHYVPSQENDASDSCISFVFRSIGTFINPINKIKYGIGAKYSSYEERLAHIDEKTIEQKNINDLIVSMYHYENTTDLSKIENIDQSYFNNVKYLTL